MGRKIVLTFGRIHLKCPVLSKKIRGHRLVVRTPGFHPGNRGSTPRGPAIL